MIKQCEAKTMEQKTKICGFYPEEIEAIKNSLGLNSDSMADIKKALLSSIGVTAHERVLLTQEQKTARNINRIADNYGVSNEDLQKALRLLKLN